MGSIVHRSVPTNLKWFPTCSHAHAMFQDRFKDVQVGSRWFSTLYILSPNFHNRSTLVSLTDWWWWFDSMLVRKPQVVTRRKAKSADQKKIDTSLVGFCIFS